jgi:hypothetical protein
MSGLTRASIRLGAFGAVVIIGASLLRDRYRNIETAAAVGLVNLFGGPHHTHLLGHSVLVSPGDTSASSPS